MGRRGVWAAWAAFLLSVGCAEDPPEPYQFLNLEIQGDVAEGAFDDSSLRVALLWADPGAASGISVTDDVAIPSGESRFQFPMRRWPPDSALYPFLDDHAGFVAYGSLVAYDDRDGDEQLDLTSVDADAMGDQVNGWTPGVGVIYAEPVEASAPYQLGINIERAVVTEENGADRSLLALDAVLGLELFDEKDVGCFGMTPPPLDYPRAIDELLTSRDTRPEDAWPYFIGVPRCDGETLPPDWWSIDCGARPGEYLVGSLEWPASDSIGETCGWARRGCLLRPRDDTAGLAELPACGE